MYLRGGVPFALHFNLVLLSTGDALNAFFNVSGSEKVGGVSKKRTISKEILLSHYRPAIEVAPLYGNAFTTANTTVLS